MCVKERERERERERETHTYRIAFIPLTGVWRFGGHFSNRIVESNSLEGPMATRSWNSRVNDKSKV